MPRFRLRTFYYRPRDMSRKCGFRHLPPGSGIKSHIPADRVKSEKGAERRGGMKTAGANEYLRRGVNYLNAGEYRRCRGKPFFPVRAFSALYSRCAHSLSKEMKALSPSLKIFLLTGQLSLIFTRVSPTRT